MKKINLLVVLALITNVILAQVPNLINYQTVIRDNSGDIVANQAVDFEISIITGSISGTPIYTEAHTVTTNGFGIVNFLIGGGTPSLGIFNTIDWSVSSHYVNTKVDVGSGLEDMGTQQLMSVPYALLAENVVNDSVIDNDADPANEIQSLSIDGDTIEISNGNSIVLPVANNGGKTYFTISGAITNAEAATKIAQGVGPNTQIVLIQNTTGLTSIDLSSLTEMISIKITGNADLATVNFSGVTEIFEELYVQNNGLLATVDFSSLLRTTAIDISENSQLQSLNLQSLTNVSQDINITDNNVLPALNLPSIQVLGMPFVVTNNAMLNTIDISAATSFGNGGFIKRISVSNNPVLTSFSTTANDECYIAIDNNVTMTLIDIPNITIKGGGFSFSISMSQNALPTANINTILAQLVAQPVITIGSGTVIYLNNQTPPAPPTGQGITDKATLIANGNTVNTD